MVGAMHTSENTWEEGLGRDTRQGILTLIGFFIEQHRGDAASRATPKHCSHLFCDNRRILVWEGEGGGGGSKQREGQEEEKGAELWSMSVQGRNTTRH